VRELLAHPWIARADRTADGLLLSTDPAALAVAPEPGGLVAEHLEHWSEVYDWTYRSGDGELAGWRATDTGAPLAADHMAEWVDRTAELVLASRPARVLELGCGTGMLLRRLRPHLRSYVGTDIAADAVVRLGEDGDGGVRVVRAAAHETGSAAVVAALGGVAPDCVLLNSVTQCFPSVAYLAAVLHEVIALVVPGGTVVVGDMRHAGLLEDYARWSGRRAETDEELLLDPPTLAAVAASAPRRVTLAAHAKTLTADTELTRYRFDAVLHVDGGPVPHPASHPWEGPAALRELVAGAGPVRVDGIPNRLLRDCPGAVSGAQLRAAVAGCDAAVLLDVNDPYRLSVVAPAAAAALPPAAVAGPARPHEPLAAFARTRVVETARRVLRRAGQPVPGPVTAQLPSGAGHSGAAVAADAAAADLAGRVTIGSGQVPVEHASLRRLPLAVAQLDAVALQALARLFADGPPEVADRHAWIVRRWSDVLARHPVRDRPGLDPDGPVLDRACAALGYPAAMATFFREALTRLPELLRDELPAQALLFPDGDLGTSLSKDRRNVSNGYLHGSCAHVLARAAATRAAPLRVLELGGGAGGGTEAALAGLGEAPVDYLFTDVSRFFTEAAADRFGSRVRCALLDVDADLVAQGATPGGADVVLAANVLHCARHVGRSLRHIRPLLAPGGLLLVVEATREHPIVLATMQFLLSPRDGGPPPGAEDVRAGGPVFLDAPGWRTALAGAGFRTLHTLPGPDSPLAAPAQHLFVATAL
jgi:SAM-dependent methyltransferase